MMHSDDIREMKIIFNAEITEYQFKLVSFRLCKIIKNHVNDEINVILIIVIIIILIIANYYYFFNL